jgi:O-antigen ligase
MKIKIRHIASFIAGALLTGICYFIILFIYFILPFSFSGQTLSEKEVSDALVFFSLIIILSITCYAVFRQYRLGRKFTAAGIAAIGIIALYGIIYTGKIYVRNINYYEAFNKTNWSESRFKPFKMAKTLVKKDKLTGLSKQEVLDQLGPPENPCNDECLYFKYTTDENWELRIRFRSNKVKEAYLYEEGLF